MSDIPPSDLPPDMLPERPRQGFNWAAVLGALIVMGGMILLVAIAARYGMVPAN